MATQAELAADLSAVVAKQKKTLEEIKSIQTAVETLRAKITELEELIASGTVSQELADAVAAVKTQAQIVDDQIPDLAPE